MDNRDQSQLTPGSTGVSASGDAFERAGTTDGRPASTFVQSCLYVVMFVSGTCALLYETVWVRMMGLSVGSTTQAASCVIAAFLGGLAIGAWLAAKLLDRIKLPALAVYALLELGIAATAPTVSFLLQWLPGIFGELTSNCPNNFFFLTAERLIAASLMLLPPTILMGATLPLASEFLARHYAKPAHFFSMLYGLNTLGAVFGCLAATFLAFPYLGIFNSILLAAALNLAVAAIAIGLSRSTNNTHRSGFAVSPEIEDSINLGSVQISHRLLCVIAAFLGFTALSYEIVWLRLLRIYTGSTTYSFTAMLSTFLLGLVLGSLYYNRILRKNTHFCGDLDGQLRLLSKSQFGAAAFSLFGLLVLPLLTIVRNAAPALNNGQPVSQAGLLAMWYFFSFSLLVIPATFIGVGFPAIGGLATTVGKSVVRGVGMSYAANTLGCIVGSLVCGLLLIPAIGSQYTMEMLLVVNVISAVVLDRLRTDKPHPIKIAALAAPFVVALFLLPQQYLEKVYAHLTNGKVLAVKEDSVGIVLCLDYPHGKRLMVNGTPYSGDKPPSLRYMRALAHLPILLHKSPKNVLIICFGIGTTCGAAASHPEVEHLDICEISPAVMSCAGLFEKTNNGVVRDPRVQVSIEDGRNFLLRTKKKYDIIAFEPPPPYDSGIVNLYSKEFYELCQKRLNMGGIICQWAPMHLEESYNFWKAMVKTADVFQHVSLWLPSSDDPLILASDSAIQIDFAELSKRMTTPAVQRSMQQVGMADPYQLLALYFIGEEQLKRCLAGVQPVTDDHPSLEFFIPLSGDPAIPLDLKEYESDVRKIITGAPPDEKKLADHIKGEELLKKAAKCAWNNDTVGAERLYNEALKLDANNEYIKAILRHP